MKNKIEKLIKTLDPTKTQCSKCGKWFSKGSTDYDHVKFLDICVECYKYREAHNMANKAEELINTLNPNTIQCCRCRKWFSKDEDDYGHIRLFDICIKCYNYTDNNNYNWKDSKKPHH